MTVEFDPDTTRCVRYVPAAYGKEPATPSEALEAAACVLEEEGRWIQDTWYQHHDPTLEEYEDNPFCNGWSACADGALQAVTVGAFKTPSIDNNTWFLSGVTACHVDTDEGRSGWQLYEQAHEYARKYVAQISDHRYNSLPRFNDAAGRTREEVVSTLRGAAGYAAQQEAA